MKKITYLLLTILIAGSLSSCFENPSLVYEGGTVVEFDAAVTTSPAVGKTYPLLSVANGSGIQTARINLVGPQKTTEQTVKVSIETAATSAVSGTHFKLVSDNITIPANSSFGEVKVEILRVAPQAGKSVDLVLNLDGNGSDIKPSENFKRLGWSIKL
jgi:hypothetical protein